MDLTLKIDPAVANWAIFAAILLGGAVVVLIANARRPLFPRAPTTPGGEA